MDEVEFYKIMLAPVLLCGSTSWMLHNRNKSGSVVGWVHAPSEKTDTLLNSDLYTVLKVWIWIICFVMWQSSFTIKE